MSVAEGKARRAAGTDILDAACEREDRKRLLDELLRNAAALALENPKGRFTCDDVRESLTTPIPDDFPHRAFGSVFSRLSRNGVIKRVGFHVSSVPSNRAHAVGLWQLRSRVAAQKLLAEL